MSYKFEDGKDAIIDAVVNKVKEQNEGQFCSVFTEFVEQFYGTVALEDLLDWDTDDLYGAASNFLSLMHNRKPKETKIRIYNPDFERHCWQTTHTVVEILCDDMPFIVDTIRMVMNRMGIASHLIIYLGGLKLVRDKNDDVTKILPRESKLIKGAISESPIFIEIDRQTDPIVLQELHTNLEKVLTDNRAVSEDWQVMSDKVLEVVKELKDSPAKLDHEEVAETIEFLTWIADHHFTFLGVRDYELVKKGNQTVLQSIPDTGFGVLRNKSVTAKARDLSAMTPEARELTLSSCILLMSKTNTEATVHRDAYTDYIGVKRFDKKGDVIGERRIIGLYTSAAYNTNPKQIPFLRHKVAQIMKNSKLDPHGHAGKVLLHILDTLPRDDLIQGSDEELLEIAMGIFHMQERQRIRLFVRQDIYRRFISCLVYVPKDIFNTVLRKKMQEVLSDSFNAQGITFSTLFSESVLARIHFIVRIDSADNTVFNFKEIEKKLIEIGKTWSDELQEILFESCGEEKGNFLFAKYKNAIQEVYKENFSPRTALFDVRHIESINSDSPVGMNFYRPLNDFSEHFRLKIYRHDEPMPLSDVLPIIENLGLRAISERPYVFEFEDGSKTWINDFSLQYVRGCQFKLDDIRELFQKAFIETWFGNAENDGFNYLVLASGLDWRQVAMLRTYAKYFKQIGLAFSQEYIESALINNAPITKKLANLFELRFKPRNEANTEDDFNTLVSEILTDLDEVAILDEDRIIRQYINTISSTTRTNFYQVDSDGKHKSYISIKLNSKTVPGIPRPCPMVEIFVYSPRFEGIHLRGGKVARGGLRWSDRKEDYRTEILGLMKAQQVKNAVIVPSGAKGGFVAKQLPTDGSREGIQEEGIACYKQFIHGLLDITDNYIDKKVVNPVNVMRYDEDDPYLVVAADKGTATFSDIANEISIKYNFWLGDAFASGGSVGYDHKKMGITARGAWESVKRHFYEIGTNINVTDFTVVGIGDMAGDVFGNGMLLSEHILLVAAFNHMHIFVDPYPDAQISFAERKRLFEMPRSQWSDYKKELISKGGGVFSRNAKSISVTPEMRRRFDIKQANIEPNELLKIILRAQVDLLWSAGIGTFVKSQSETNADAGDRSNDAIRINATDLGCLVVGEGGNLGLTQLARVEYALKGGHIYTDFIDNSAGVSCSDKEVNIKILLNGIVASGDLTEKQRNLILAEMTDEVAGIVLRENYLQPRAVNQALAQSVRSLELHSRYISELERTGKIDRELEFLPSEKALIKRKLTGKGLTSPGISVLQCYSKIILKESILASDVPEDIYLKQFLVRSFPKLLQNKYSSQMQDHPLRREIIATRLSNHIVNEMGFSFVYRLQDETGAPVSSIVRAYIIARSSLNMSDIWHQIESLDSVIGAEQQKAIMMIYVRLLRRSTRWFLRNKRMQLDITASVNKYAIGVQAIKNAMPDIFDNENKEQYDKAYNEYIKENIPALLAHELTITPGLFAAMDIIEVAHQFNIEIEQVAQVYFAIGEFLQLNWIRTEVIIHPTENQWESLSREALRDDLDWQQRSLAAGVIRLNKSNQKLNECLDAWSNNHEDLINRWKQVLANLKSSSSLNYTMFFVAIRELLDLTQTTMQESEVE